MSKKHAVVGLVIGAVMTGAGLVGTVYYGIKCFKKN